MKGGKYCCTDERKAYEDFYLNQCGHGMPVFCVARMQRGHNIEGIFSGFFCSIFPMLKKVAPVIGKKALLTGIDIVSDVAAGQSLKKSAKSRVSDALKEGISSFISTDNSQSGSGYRKKRKRSIKSKITRKKKTRHFIVMVVISPRSCLCVKGELNLFTVPPTQTSVEHGCTMDYHPVSTLTDNVPVEFNILGSGEDYIDLTNTFLHLDMKITAADEANVADAAAVGPVNLLMHSLFSQVDIALNDKLVSSSTNT